MSFSGTLDDFSPVEIISVLDILKKSGKLRLTQGEDQGLVVFRDGKIIYAASSGFRENLGSMLLARGLVNQDELAEALRRQASASEEFRLGTILIEMGTLSQEELNDMVLEQVIRTVSEFGHWDSGQFDFSSVRVVDHGEVELPTGELWAPLGLKPVHVLLRLAQEKDEMQQEQEPIVIDSAASLDIGAEETGEAASVKDFVGELRGPQVKGELIQRLLQQASEIFGRVVLFSVSHDGFRSIAKTGEALLKPDDGSHLLEITLGRNLPSLLRRCVASGHTVMAKLPQDEGDHQIVDALGGPVDEKSVAMPLAFKDETVLILYGDSLQVRLRVGWAEELEGLLAKSGRQIEADVQAEIGGQTVVDQCGSPAARYR